jgi:hypothetical protein
MYDDPGRQARLSDLFISSSSVNSGVGPFLHITTCTWHSRCILLKYLKHKVGWSNMAFPSSDPAHYRDLVLRMRMLNFVDVDEVYYYCAKNEQRLLVLDKSKSRDLILKKERRL